MRLAAALTLALLCSSAWAADPFVPFRKLFPGPRPPVVAEPLPPIPPPPVVALPEPEPEPVKEPEPDPRDAKSPLPPLPMAKPKVRPKQPISLAPCEGPPLARSCAEVCDYATRYTYRELQAMRAVGIASGWIENRPVSCQEERMGRDCIRKFCKDTAKK